MQFLRLLLFTGYISFVCCNNSSLRLIYAFFRHGERTPFASYPNDPYNDPSIWPEGWGELTNAGKLRLYERGQVFRSKYEKFIPEYFRDDFLHVQSTDIARTLMSGEGFLAGLYPADNRQVWLKGMPWQPIPIHTLPKAEDPVYQGSNCRRAFAELRRVFGLPEVVKYLQQYSEMWKYLETKSGKRLKNIIDFSELYDTLKIEKESNLTLPTWTEKCFPKPMEDVFMFGRILLTYTFELKRLRMGPMLKSIVDTFTTFKNGTLVPSSRRLYLNSVHDVNIAGLIAATLNATKPFQPPYGTVLSFELHEIEEHYFVKILLATDAEEDFEILTIPGCEELCPLDKFVTISYPFIPSDWKAECDA